ncbi:uncharacterized protein (DUF1501 family) [Tahibacter aquaticus]|uniref:Uncharacterized protein (DUF1501 family) n=2 Tax=Tahibacter aquaticus TaxID=520092 RepID=A0A4R6YJZ8_9GAMM|nr:uncharacterized protein (DUF1501 family) [Tahibacter aquaticus]
MGMNDARRDFLKLAGLAAAAPLLPLPRLAFAQASATAGDVLVVVFQRGGMDGLNVLVPFAEDDYYRLRPTVSIPRSGSGAVIDLDGRFGLHPALAPLQPAFAAGELALVHATGAPSGSRSHFSGMDIMERAALEQPNLASGWLNRHLQSRGGGSDFQGVGLGHSVQRSLGGAAPVLGMAAFEEFALQTRSARADAMAATLDALYAGTATMDAVAHTAFRAMDQLQHADPAQFAAANGADYPATTFGRQLQQVAQLIKADVGLEAAAVDIGGWDHHNDELRLLAPLLDEFARGLAALRTDLGPLMSKVCLVSMSEFGRRAYENASGGTDHGTGNCLFVLGGGVAGGRVYADWPGLRDADLVRGDLAITTDYRSVLAEMLRKRRGETALAQVFPGFAGTMELGIFRAGG